LFFNKSDIYRRKETEKFEELKSIYESIGYKNIFDKRCRKNRNRFISKNV